MLDFFGAEVMSLWLTMAGVPDSLGSLDAIALTSLQEAPDRGAEQTMKHYLQQLTREGLSETSQGIWLQSGARLLATNQGTTPLPAASVTKVATTLAALETWGANHQFETLITATGPIQSGVLQGDLVIQGGGDPLFVWEEAIALGHSLQKIGISRITGNLLIVGNFMMNFEDDRTRSGALLKQALNSKMWDEDAKADYEQLPKDTPRPTIEIKGAVKVLAANTLLPKQILLLRHRSLPLTDLLKRMNVHSQNEMSQMLADNLGGIQTTVQKAAAAAGVDPAEIQLVNGSGLSMNNRISPRAACAMFAAIDHYIHPRNLTIADLFPVAGWDYEGTLEDRDLPRASVVKTGTLNEVSALTGVLPTHDRGLVWFAIINRGSDISNLRKQQEAFLKALHQQWGSLPSPTMIEPSAWVRTRRATLRASDRNEIVYGG